MKKDPIGPPPNRQTIAICLHLFESLRLEALRLTPNERAVFRGILDDKYPTIAKPLADFLRKETP